MRSFVLPAKTPLPNAAISDTGKLVKYLTERGSEFQARKIVFNSQSISEGAKLEVLQKGEQDMKRPTYWDQIADVCSLQHSRPL